MPSSFPSRAVPRLGAGAVLALVIVAGALLRLFDLGAMSFRWDEDLSSLAAKGIAEHGIPELPSGMIYLRGLAFSYAMAASAGVLGFGEWALRLPAAIVGIAAIALSFAFGRRLFGTAVGLVLAALVAFSAWDVEFSRYARMYAPFGFFYLATLLLIWRYRVVEQSLAGGLLAIAAALVAVSLHDLGYTLAIAFLVPAAMRGRAALAAPRSLIFPGAAFAVVAAAFFAWRNVQDRYFYRAAELAQSAAGAALSDRADAGRESTGLLGIVESVLTQFRLPDLPAFSALGNAAPWAAAGIVAVGLAAAVAILFAHRPRLALGERLLLGAVALCVALQLFNVALLAAIALALVKRRGINGLREPHVAAAAALIGVGFVLWLALALGLDLVSDRPGAAAAKETIRQLLNFPSFFVFWAFPREYPMMSIAALVGGLWILDRAARPEPDRAAVFLLAVFALPVVLNGLFETRYGFFRYSLPFNPLFLSFVALGLVRWTEVVDAWRTDRRPAAAVPAREGTAMPSNEGAAVPTSGAAAAPMSEAAAVPAGRAAGASRRRAATLPTRRAAAGTALLIALVAAFDLNPLRAWLVATRDHDDRGVLYDAFEIERFRDYRSAAEHVLANAGDEDSIFVFECREYFNYIGRLDGCLISGTYRSGDELIQTYVENGVLRDLYVGVPLFTSAKELEREWRETEGTKWLLASDSVTSTDAVSKDFRRFLERHEHRIVYVADDDDTKVYRF